MASEFVANVQLPDELKTIICDYAQYSPLEVLKRIYDLRQNMFTNFGYKTQVKELIGLNSISLIKEFCKIIRSNKFNAFDKKAYAKYNIDNLDISGMMGLLIQPYVEKHRFDLTPQVKQYVNEMRINCKSNLRVWVTIDKINIKKSCFDTRDFEILHGPIEHFDHHKLCEELTTLTGLKFKSFWQDCGNWGRPDNYNVL